MQGRQPLLQRMKASFHAANPFNSRHVVAVQWAQRRQTRVRREMAYARIGMVKNTEHYSTSSTSFKKAIKQEEQNLAPIN